jgi:hypothetical protein
MIVIVAGILKRELEFGFNLFVVCVNAGFDGINFSIKNVLVKLLGFYFSPNDSVDFILEFDFRHFYKALWVHVDVDDALCEGGTAYNYVNNVLFERYVLDGEFYVHTKSLPIVDE